MPAKSTTPKTDAIHEPPKMDKTLQREKTPRKPATDSPVAPIPSNEAHRPHDRAEAAERALERLQTEFARIEQRLEASRETVSALERRQKIDAQLSAAEPIDLEAARLLTEIAVTQMDEPDVRLAITELRRDKPWLFRAGAGASSMAERLEPASPMHDAAERAAASGDRRDILQYLRLRRKA